MQAMHYMVAHFGVEGHREVTLPIVAIKDDNAMMVLFKNRLVPVFSAVPGMTLELIEIVPQDQAVEKYYPKVAKKTPKDEPNVVRSKASVAEPKE